MLFSPHTLMHAHAHTHHTHSLSHISHTRTHMHARMYTHTHTHTHTHTQGVEHCMLGTSWCRLMESHWRTRVSRDAVRLLAKSDLTVQLEIIPAHNLTIVPDLSQEEGGPNTL